jgi:hypothetical protein
MTATIFQNKNKMKALQDRKSVKMLQSQPVAEKNFF